MRRDTSPYCRLGRALANDLCSEPHLGPIITTLVLFVAFVTVVYNRTAVIAKC